MQKNEDVESEKFYKKGDELISRFKAKKVRDGCYENDNGKLFYESSNNDSNSPLSLSMFPACFLKYANLTTCDPPNCPDLIADDEGSEDNKRDL